MTLPDRRDRSGRGSKKTSCVKFMQLRQLLLSLGFQKQKMDRGWRFEHAESGAIFLYRRFVLHAYVCLPDLLSTQMHLDWRGLMSPEAFEDALNTKTLA